MKKDIKRQKLKQGKRPGSLVFVGEKRKEDIDISIIDFNESLFEEKALNSIEESFPYKEKETISWININGLHKTDIIEAFGLHFNINSLVLEDILNTSHRPKIEDHGNYLYVVLKIPYFDEEKKSVLIEQISIVTGKNFIASFQEFKGGIFDPIRNRIRKSIGKLRKSKVDYLLHALLDSTIDNYLLVIERLSEKMESIEEDFINNDTISINSVYSLKRELIDLRKNLIPAKEIIYTIHKGESELIAEKNLPFFKDIYDHIIHSIDQIDTYRDLLTEMLNTYNANLSNKTNEIMKVLTIMASIFIPLTFIAGVYGMNFENMPELKFQNGYYITLTLMLIVGFGMIMLFKKKKWL